MHDGLPDMGELNFLDIVGCLHSGIDDNTRSRLPFAEQPGEGLQLIPQGGGERGRREEEPAREQHVLNLKQLF